MTAPSLMDPERNVINQVPITIPSVSIPNCPPGSLLVPVDLKRPIIVASKNVIPIDVSDLRSQSFGLPVRYRIPISFHLPI